MVSRFDFNNTENNKRKNGKRSTNERTSRFSANNRKSSESNGKSENTGSQVKRKSRFPEPVRKETPSKEKKSNITVFPLRNDISYKIILYIVLAVVFVYLFFCVYKSMNAKKISTYQVKEGALSEQNSYTGMILRDETVFYAKSSGYYNFYLKEGEKASYNDLVYTIDGTGKIKDMMTNQTEEASTLSSDDLVEIKSEIVKFSKDYEKDSFIDVYDFKDDLDSVSLKMSNLYILNKISSMSLNGTNVNKYYCGDGLENAKTGYVVYYYDELEDLPLEEVNSSYFKDYDYERHMIANNEMVTEGDFVYKLVTSNTWQLVFPISEEKAKEFDGKDMKVKFSKNQESLKGKVKIIDAIAPGKNTSVEKICVVTFNTSVADYLNNRFIDFEIYTNENNGYKIPKSSVVEKEFLLVPDTIAFDFNETTNTVCVKLDKYLEDGTKTFVTTELNVYRTDGGEYYVDGNVVKLGNTVYAADETTSYTLNKTATLLGVYKINQGYADFKNIKKLYENEEYIIVDPAYTMIKPYDYIALDASKVNDNEYIYE
ncbi:MAG: hypothetical protein K5776_03320 [Lachnospiraceae bacterium]|nr:hypothetical protein [Lachnospiraceae bacterium]